MRHLPFAFGLVLTLTACQANIMGQFCGTAGGSSSAVTSNSARSVAKPLKAQVAPSVDEMNDPVLGPLYHPDIADIDWVICEQQCKYEEESPKPVCTLSGRHYVNACLALCLEDNIAACPKASPKKNSARSE